MKQFNWSQEDEEAGRATLERWANGNWGAQPPPGSGSLRYTARAYTRHSVGAALVLVLMEADRAVYAAQARASFQSIPGAPEEENFWKTLPTWIPGVGPTGGAPLGSRQAEADAVGLGENYRLTQRFVLWMLRNSPPASGNWIRDHLNPQLGGWVFPVAVFGVAALTFDFLKVAAASYAQAKVLITNHAATLVTNLRGLTERNEMAVITGKPLMTPKQWGTLGPAIQQADAMGRAPWFALGAVAALGAASYLRKPKTKKTPARQFVEVRANPRRGRRTVQKPRPRRAAKRAAATKRKLSASPVRVSFHGRTVGWRVDVKGGGRPDTAVSPPEFMSKAGAQRYIKETVDPMLAAGMTRTQLKKAISRDLNEPRGHRKDYILYGGFGPPQKKNPPARKKQSKAKKRNPRGAADPTKPRCKKKPGRGSADRTPEDFGHADRPKKYAGMRRSAFAYPDRWLYPIDTARRTRAAAQYFGIYCNRYPPQMRDTIAAAIDRAAEKFGIALRGKKKNPSAYDWGKTRKRLSEARVAAGEARWVREKELAATRRACAADRKGVTAVCADKRKRARDKANRAIDQSREDRKAIRTAHKKGKRAVLRSEHDDLTAQNIPDRLRPLWEEMADRFTWKRSTPDARAVRFMEYLDENPDEVEDWDDRQGLADDDYARAERAHHYRGEAAPF
jgi:hypothetical protein